MERLEKRDCPVVRNDDPFEAELTSEEVGENFGRPATWQSVDLVVCVHGGREGGLVDGGAERCRDHVPQPAGSHGHLAVVEPCVGDAVAEEVFGGGVDAFALDPLHISNGPCG